MKIGQIGVRPGRIGQLPAVFKHSVQKIQELIGRTARGKGNLQQAESMFRGLAENSVLGVYVMQSEAFLFVNSKMAEMFGYTAEEMVAFVRVFDIVPDHQCEVLVHAKEVDMLFAKVCEIVHESGGYPIVRCIEQRICAVITPPLKSSDRLFGSLVIFASENDAFTNDEVSIIEELVDNLSYGITALHADAASTHYAQMLAHHANHDALTGLANRYRLSHTLQRSIAAARHTGLMVAVLLLDLDRFKIISDTLGHPAGDTLLQSVAARLRSYMRATDTVARFLAMYHAKQQGRANYQFFTDEVKAASSEKHALEAELHHALSCGELLLHYQPMGFTYRLCSREGMAGGQPAADKHCSQPLG